MPGSGKSSIGRALARLMDRPFYDTDDMITEACGHTPSEIIREQGEPVFRKLEAQQIQKAVSMEGVVISTGGGAVLLEENRTCMRAHARVYRIDRPLALLATGDRPLSVHLEALYQKRLPAYEAAAHVTIQNTGTVEEAAQAILQEFQQNGGACL